MGITHHPFSCSIAIRRFIADCGKNGGQTKTLMPRNEIEEQWDDSLRRVVPTHGLIKARVAHTISAFSCNATGGGWRVAHTISAFSCNATAGGCPIHRAILFYVRCVGERKSR